MTLEWLSHKTPQRASACVPLTGQAAPYCQQCAVRSVALFSALPPEDLAHLHATVDDLQFANGEVLFEQGEQANALYTIKLGLVKLDRIAEDDTLRVARLAQRGDLLGLESCLPTPFFYRATAIGPVRVCRLPTRRIEDLAAEFPALRRALLTRWFQALRETDDWAALQSTGTPLTRLARLLLKLAIPQLHDTFYLPNRGDLGMLIGTRLETASRLVAAFLRDGLLEKVGPRLYRVNREALDALVWSGAEGCRQLRGKVVRAG